MNEFKVDLKAYYAKRYRCIIHHDPFFNRGLPTSPPTDSKYFPGDVVVKIDDNSVGVVVNGVDNGYETMVTDTHGFIPMIKVRLATAADINSLEELDKVIKEFLI